MGLAAIKPVFGVSDKTRLKPVSSATEASLKIEISLVASLAMILSKTQITKALIRLHRCAGWSAPLLFANPEDSFLASRPICRINLKLFVYYLLITPTNSLDPNQAPQNVGTDLDPNCLTLKWYF